MLEALTTKVTPPIPAALVDGLVRTCELAKEASFGEMGLGVTIVVPRLAINLSEQTSKRSLREVVEDEISKASNTKFLRVEDEFGDDFSTCATEAIRIAEGLGCSGLEIKFRGIEISSGSLKLDELQQLFIQRLGIVSNAAGQSELRLPVTFDKAALIALSAAKILGKELILLDGEKPRRICVGPLMKFEEIHAQFWNPRA